VRVPLHHITSEDGVNQQQKKLAAMEVLKQQEQTNDHDLDDFGLMIKINCGSCPRF
jgi:hypothetical protein